MYATEKEKDQDAQMSAFLREDLPPGAPTSESSRMRPSPQFSTSHDVTTDSNSPAHTVARQDIRASAEKILYTFLLPGAEREITLPGSITQDVTTSIEEYGRDDPEVFDVAKDYVFQAMERDAFPGFLRMKALGNLIPPTLVMRLIVGLIAMFGGFWAAFILIFLDKSRATRCWVRTFSHLATMPHRGLTPFFSSFSRSPSGCIFWPRTSIPWTLLWLWSATASTHPLTSPAFASPTSASCWRSERSWCWL